MRCIYQAPTLQDGMKARILQSLLDAQGIRAEVRNEALQGLLPEIGYVPVSVWILDDAEADRAEGIRDGFISGPAAETAGPDWNCPACRETVEAQFAACWNCGAPR